MLSPDLQRIKHIRDSCKEIAKTIDRYGHSFDQYAADADYQRSVSFCILQIGELSGGLSAEYRDSELYPVGTDESHAEPGCT